MILYANGCSHTAAAEAVVPECFALDDGRHGIDRRPHPLNLAESWCSHLAAELGMDLVCEAESGGSNDRTLRTTRAWIDQNPERLADCLVVLQWTTWEREEWFYENTWYQVNASGQDWVPKDLRARYKQYILDIDWDHKTRKAHEKIWLLHQDLKKLRIRHLFFNGFSHFERVTDRLDWGPQYMAPYSQNGTFFGWLTKNGGTFSTKSSQHFDAASHRLWAENVLQYINRNQILTFTDEISSD